MASMTDIPTTISSEATQHVADLGLQKALEQMLDHARQIVPGLRSIRVTLQPAYDMDIPCVLIEPTVGSLPAGLGAQREWWSWRSTTFPPEISQHFAVLITGG